MKKGAPIGNKNAFGKHHKLSENTKEKMRGNKNVLGKHWKLSKEKIRKGENSPNWKDGRYKEKNYQKKYLQKLRFAALEVLGGKCIRCGFEDKRALQIDHINGGGSKERKTGRFKGSFHQNVIKSFLNKENKYQLLCANCNWIKRFENYE